MMQKVTAAFTEGGRPLETFDAYLYDNSVLVDVFNGEITFRIFTDKVEVVNGWVYADIRASNFRLISLKLRETELFEPAALDNMRVIDFVRYL